MKKRKGKNGPSAREALSALERLQKDAKERGLDKLTDSEIDDIIEQTRKEMREKETPVKRAPKKGPKKRKAP